MDEFLEQGYDLAIFRKAHPFTEAVSEPIFLAKYSFFKNVGKKSFHTIVMNKLYFANANCGIWVGQFFRQVMKDIG